MARPEGSTETAGWIATLVFAVAWAGLSLWSWLTDGALVFTIGGLFMAIVYAVLAARKWRKRHRPAVSAVADTAVAHAVDPPSRV